MEGFFQFVKKFEKYTKNVDLLIAVGLLVILAVMIIPMPTMMLDLALTFSLALSILILLVSIYIHRALEFSVFPSLLLITTLFRLALNVATTRKILTSGHEGPQAAGEVILSFGNFVVGNNYVIGTIVFIILVIINFIVITKGSGRVSEVAARFTLDAMPGKQMSIDADLNAGIINEQEAKRRRQEIEMEADFYGAMDGASKFVRGDAIAGIIITLVNVIGGLLIGVLQKGLSASTAAEYYTMLTIGDGLLSQIPALIISTAAGIVVTRNSRADKNMGNEMAAQLFLNPRALGISGAVLSLMALVPGLPTVPFMIMGGFLGGFSYIIKRYQAEEKENQIKAQSDLANKPQKENIESLLPLDVLELEVGYGLIQVVDSNQSGDLLERIVSIRKQFALDLGIIVPSVHIRDNLQLAAGEYRIMIKGNKVGGGTLKPECLMAMDPGNVTDRIPGTPTKEPAFGLDAVWISKTLKEQAEIAGYTVVDLPTVIATHLTEIIRAHCSEFIGRQEASGLIESLKKTHPKVVEDLVPEKLSLGQLVRVLQSLLKEQVSIRDLRTIFETLSDESGRSKDIEVLTESVRKALARSITSKYTNDIGSIPVLTLHPSIEDTISNSLIQTEQGVQLVMDPSTAQKMITKIAQTVEENPSIAGQPILLTSPTIRRHLFKLTTRFIPQLIVLSHNELTADASVKSVATVSLNGNGKSEMSYAG